MRFKPLRTLDEALLLETVIRLESCYATSSKSDLHNLLTKDFMPKRIAYCDDEWLWLIGNAYSTYHEYMVKEANKAGMTKTDDLIGKFGKFYFIPYMQRGDFSIKDYMMDEYPAIDQCIVYDDFIIGVENGAEDGLDKLKSIFTEPIIDEFKI